MARMFSNEELQRTRWQGGFASGATPFAIDIPVSSTYRSSMFARVVSMLAIIGVAVMTMAFSAHAARMSIPPEQAVHVGEITNSAAGIEPACTSKHCGSADMDAGTCELVCAGFQSFSYHRAVVLETNTRQPPMFCRLMPAFPVGRSD
ncbi:hypothetical protein HED54_22805 [Ochrobactrum anthropi ATCC 49188]|nr:hypothetical protein [Brucella anthropi ATCC 49188]